MQRLKKINVNRLNWSYCETKVFLSPINCWSQAIIKNDEEEIGARVSVTLKNTSRDFKFICFTIWGSTVTMGLPYALSILDKLQFIFEQFWVLFVWVFVSMFILPTKLTLPMALGYRLDIGLFNTVIISNHW